MTQSIAGQPAPELAVPYWIDAEGQKRPPLTLKELGARHRLLFFYQHWCGGCQSHYFARGIDSIAINHWPTELRFLTY